LGFVEYKDAMCFFFPKFFLERTLALVLVVLFTMIERIGTTKLASTYEMKALQRIIGGKLGKAIHLLHYHEAFNEEKSLCEKSR
jgi:hypothetical protein